MRFSIYLGLPVAEMLESVSGPTHSSLLHLAVEGSKVDIVVYLLSRGISRRTKVNTQS